MSVFNNDNNNDNHNNPNSSISDTTNIRINTTNNFKLLKHSRNQSFADIIRIALEKREEICQQQSELELSDQIHLARLSQRGRAAAAQQFKQLLVNSVRRNSNSIKKIQEDVHIVQII
ncbi:unnamed protein product [Trichobilharzia szidati]|nr:unnamed protein product [Trichobilharzia szidati]